MTPERKRLIVIATSVVLVLATVVWMVSLDDGSGSAAEVEQVERAAQIEHVKINRSLARIYDPELEVYCYLYKNGMAGSISCLPAKEVGRGSSSQDTANGT
jgi:hypothetical protein